MLDPQQPLLLVLEHDDDVAKVAAYFLRTGFTKFAGYLVGGMKAWVNAGLPLSKVEQITVYEVKERANELLLLDVRSPGEWKKGHIPGAKHIFLPELPTRFAELPKTSPSPSTATAVTGPVWPPAF